jgi:hypothetical protein
MPDKNRWVVLDFLGFSRPNRAFSMGCAGFSQEKKILAPFSAPGALGRARASGQSQSAALLKPRAYLISDYLH